MQRHLSNFSKSAITYNNNVDVQKIANALIAALIKQYLQDNALIIDIGCGSGALKSLLPNHNIIGLDGAFNMCVAATQNHPTICADANALPFEDKTIGNISSSLCLQWVNPLEPAIAEIARVLQNNGYAIIALLTKGTMQELEHIYQESSIPSRLLSYLTDDEVAKLFAKYQLKIQHHKTKKYIINHQNALAFFKQLKWIGAHQTNHPPLSLQQLNKVMKLYDNEFMNTQGLPVTYMVSYLVAQYHS